MYIKQFELRTDQSNEGLKLRDDLHNLAKTDEGFFYTKLYDSSDTIKLYKTSSLSSTTSTEIASISLLTETTTTLLTPETTSTYFKPVGSYAAGNGDCIRAFDFGDNGNELYTIHRTSNATTKVIVQYSLSSAYDTTSVSTTSEGFIDGDTDGPQSILLNNDGTKVYTSFGGNAYIAEYDLTTAWDISSINSSITTTHSVSDHDDTITSMEFQDGGDYLFIGGLSGFSKYSLVTSYDLSTLSFVDQSTVDADYGFGFMGPSYILIYNDSTSVKTYALRYEYDITGGSTYDDMENIVSTSIDVSSNILRLKCVFSEGKVWISTGNIFTYESYIYEYDLEDYNYRPDVIAHNDRSIITQYKDYLTGGTIGFLDYHYGNNGIYNTKFYWFYFKSTDGGQSWSSGVDEQYLDDDDPPDDTYEFKGYDPIYLYDLQYVPVDSDYYILLGVNNGGVITGRVLIPGVRSTLLGYQPYEDKPYHIYPGYIDDNGKYNFLTVQYIDATHYFLEWVRINTLIPARDRTIINRYYDPDYSSIPATNDTFIIESTVSDINIESHLMWKEYDQIHVINHDQYQILRADTNKVKKNEISNTDYYQSGAIFTLKNNGDKKLEYILNKGDVFIISKKGITFKFQNNLDIESIVGWDDWFISSSNNIYQLKSTTVKDGTTNLDLKGVEIDYNKGKMVFYHYTTTSDIWKRNEYIYATTVVNSTTYDLFKGFIVNSQLDNPSRYIIEAESLWVKDIKQSKVTASYSSKTAHYILSDIITNYTSFCTTDLISTTDTYTISYKNKTIHTIIKGLCQAERLTWYIDLDNTIIVDDGTTDSGVDIGLDLINHTITDSIASVQTYKNFQKVSKVELLGGYSGGSRIQQSFTTTDSVNTYIFRDNYPEITTTDKLYEIAQNIANNFGTDIIQVSFDCFDKPPYQWGEQLDFIYTPYKYTETTLSENQKWYVNLSAYNEDTHTVRLGISNALIFEIPEGSNEDGITADQNTQLLDSLA